MKKRVVFFSAMIMVIMIVVYAHLIETSFITVREIDIASSELVPSDSELTIVQLSDLHMNKFRPFERRIVHRVNEYRPDLIVITGDFIKSIDVLLLEDTDELDVVLDEVEKFLKSLSAPLGLWAVRGNYETVVQGEMADMVLERLRGAGVTVLTNQAAMVNTGGDSLCLMGIDFHDLPEKVFTHFKVRNKEFHAGESEQNSCSWFYDNESELWKDYEVSGRLKVTGSPTSGIGVAVYSQIATGLDQDYRFGWKNGDVHNFALEINGRDTLPIQTEVSARQGVWYCFRVGVTTVERSTEVRARVWPEGDPEPLQWQAEMSDTCSERYTRGPIGLLSWGFGEKYFDDLKVVQNNGDTLLLSEDFNAYVPEHNPKQWLDLGDDAEELGIAMRGVPSDVFTVLLVHSPDLIYEAQKYGIDLVLSGHTHGGQIRVPFIGALVSPAKLGPRYTSGLFRFGNTLLYVNRGLGEGLIPLRLLCPPEIMVIHLRPQ